MQRVDYTPAAPSRDGRAAVPRVLICARSFFCRPKKTVRRAVMLAAAAALALSAVGLAVNSRVAYAVYINGEAVGAAASREEAEAVVKSAERQLSVIFGEDYALGDVSVALSVAAAAKAEELTSTIVGGVPGVSELYAIEVDGAPLGVSEDETVLQALLDDRLQTYTGGETISAEFTNAVELTRRFVGEGVTRDPDAIRMILSDLVTVTHTERQTYILEMPFETETYEDAALYEGDLLVKTAGAPGVKAITEEAVYYNDVEQSRAAVSSSVVTPPVTELVAVGTRPRPASASYGSYQWPVNGPVSSGFGPRSGGIGSTNHQGIDILGQYGQPIYAADGGEVIFAGWSGGYGNLVKLRHDNGDVTCYGHNSRLLVTVGERVARGQQLSEMGATGTASAVHCHFEFRPGGGAAIDPMEILP